MSIDLLPSKLQTSKMVDESRLKTLPKTVGPFKVIYTMSHTIIIDEDGISNVVSIDRATPAPRPVSAPLVEQSTLTVQRDYTPTVEQLIQGAQCDTSTPEVTRDMTHRATGKVEPTPHSTHNTDRYVVDHIVSNVNKSFATDRVLLTTRLTYRRILQNTSSRTTGTAPNVRIKRSVQDIDVNTVYKYTVKISKKKELERGGLTYDNSVTLEQH